MKLIIGNKPYRHINFDKVIDSFENNIRFSMPVFKNNGTRCDELICCNHVYSNLQKTFDFCTNKKKQSVTLLTDFYKHSYKTDMLRTFYDNFQPTQYSNISYLHVATNKINDYLKQKGCPYLHKSAQARLGFMSIIDELIKGTPDIFITHFTVRDNELRESYMIQDKDNLIESTGCHLYSKDCEPKIIRWLHTQKLIDASLCLIRDTPNLELDTTFTCSPYVNDLITNYVN